MSEKIYEFKPDWLHTIVPGESILERIQDMGLSKITFAQNMNCSQKHIYKLIKGQASITEDTALRLEKVLGIPASFWMNLENTYREALAKEAEKKSLAQEQDWLKGIPLKNMLEFGWVEKYSDKGEQIIECLRFYGVASIAAWNSQTENYRVAFKSSNKFTQDKIPIQTWLRKGEIEALKITCQPFDRNELKNSLSELRALTKLADPDDFLPKLQNLCALCGVAVVFVPTPKKCPMSGATKWLSNDKALLLLSLRHKTNDHLWFAFFHEIGHILKHRKQLFLESTNRDFKGSKNLEDEADEFSSDLLIPMEYVAELSTLKTPPQIKRFAIKIGIDSGIVVGRMQHDKLINFSHLNDLKIKYDWR